MSLNSTNFDFDHRYDPLVFDDYYTQLLYETNMLHTFEESSFDFNSPLDNSVKTADQDGESSLPPEIFTTFAPIIGQPPAELKADEATVQPTSKKRHADTSVEREFNKRLRPNTRAEITSTIDSQLSKQIFNPSDSENTDSLSLESNSSETSSPHDDSSQRAEVFSTPKVFGIQLTQTVFPIPTIHTAFPLRFHDYNRTLNDVKAIKSERRRVLNAEYAQQRRDAEKSKLQNDRHLIEMTKTELTQLYGRIKALNNKIVSHLNINLSSLKKTSDIWTESQNKMQDYNKLIESQIKITQKGSKIINKKRKK